MQHQFKAGDKVYCPSMGNRIYKLSKNSSSVFPLKIINEDYNGTFTKKGKYNSSHQASSLFLATKKNKELLSSLYGFEFEEPRPFLDYHLSLGSMVLCLICKNKKDKLPNKIWELDKDTQCIDVIIDKKDNKYVSQHNVLLIWDYIYPIEVTSTGQINYLL